MKWNGAQRQYYDYAIFFLFSSSLHTHTIFLAAFSLFSIILKPLEILLFITSLNFLSIGFYNKILKLLESLVDCRDLRWCFYKDDDWLFCIETWGLNTEFNNTPRPTDHPISPPTIISINSRFNHTPSKIKPITICLPNFSQPDHFIKSEPNFSYTFHMNLLIKLVRKIYYSSCHKLREIYASIWHLRSCFHIFANIAVN